MYLIVSKFCFLEFRLLLSRVAPYCSSLPRTVWFRLAQHQLLAKLWTIWITEENISSRNLTKKNSSLRFITDKPRFYIIGALISISMIKKKSIEKSSLLFSYSFLEINKIEVRSWTLLNLSKILMFCMTGFIVLFVSFFSNWTPPNKG